MKGELNFDCNEELVEIGFVETVTHDVSHDFNVSHILSYQMTCGINGKISYYPHGKQGFKWYHVTRIGGVFNHAKLNIQTISDLKSFIRVFDTK